ncbi:thioredoxin, mitochondrial [Hyalella azteca]|uniref:Thioredoxin, mitochondrial n=1 Tax=Hyalella azteca TaxID=294128 RepID=A0A8B7PF41_HYAAZ|nr:thioredoxin, mitochondrial [Hyalella azteca]
MFLRCTLAIPRHILLRQLPTIQNAVNISSTAANKAMFNVQDEEDFQKRVIDSATPVIVDFHASWCGPCKLLAPRIEKVIAGKGEKVHLAKVDIDDISDVALKYGVSAVPSVIAIRNGKVVDKFVGLQEENRIESFINGVIAE